jgi:predicted phosphohydrolase
LVHINKKNEAMMVEHVFRTYIMTEIKLQVVSDLHLEHRPLYFDEIISVRGNVLALVGDIGSPVYDVKTLDSFLGSCSRNYQQVIYIPGNHEYYNNSKTDVGTVDRTLTALCEKYPNVLLLNNKTYTLGNVCFIGSTLWSEVPIEHKTEVEAYVNDYRCIWKNDQLNITVEDTNAEFIKNKRFLETAIEDARAKQLKIVVLTHHTPSFFKTSAPQFEKKATTHAFSTKLTCPPNTIRLWCCGHTHYNFHHMDEGYELVSNQFGYGKFSGRGYRKDLVISL